MKARNSLILVSLLLISSNSAFARKITLTLEDAPLTIRKGDSVTKKINGIPTGTPGNIDLEVKWHAMTLVPNVFEKLKIEVLHGSHVVVTKNCYSIHADKEPKCYLFPLTSNDDTEFKKSGDWKIRATNNSTNDVNGFNIQKEGTDLNPSVPGFVSTFEANCSVRYLGIVGAPFNISPHSTVEGELFGTTNSPGELHIRAKWHIAVLTPNVFDRLKVEVLYEGQVLATHYGYSIHSNEANKIDFKLNTDYRDPLKWKLRITNDTGLQVNGFDIEKGDDGNPFVPSFRSTFKPTCN
jgi:hypothetical protein